MEMKLILTSLIVNFWSIFAQPKNQIGNQAVAGKVNDEGIVRDNFQNLFESIAKNKKNNIGIYHEVLEQEAARERQVFDAMKGELQFAQMRNAYKQRNFYNKNSNINEKVAPTKRQISQYEKDMLYSLCGRWEAVSLKDDPTGYIRAKEKFKLTYPTNEETFRTKTKACMGIMASKYMSEHYDIDPADIHEEADFDEIYHNYPKIFDRSFKKWSLFQKQAELENPYRLRDISVGNDTDVDPRKKDMKAVYGLPEFVFTCLAKHRNSTKFVEYFISQEYPLPKSDPVCPTRFVFERDPVRDKIIPIAEAWIPSVDSTPVPSIPKGNLDESESTE